jgi:aspartyl-tRNA(Asn)/glutamyl-tRNA(Gln) amidotransferase subunit A
VAFEAPAVAALRSLGAICAGKTQMQEFGVLPTGISAKLGLARNPHCQDCIPGGSSGGSACVVAAGVVPFAIGTDGGGSVRIPAALCGVVGFKPTQVRPPLARTPFAQRAHASGAERFVSLVKP